MARKAMPTAKSKPTPKLKIKTTAAPASEAKDKDGKGKRKKKKAAAATAAAGTSAGAVVVSSAPSATLTLDDEPEASQSRKVLPSHTLARRITEAFTALTPEHITSIDKRLQQPLDVVKSAQAGEATIAAARSLLEEALVLIVRVPTSERAAFLIEAPRDMLMLDLALIDRAVGGRGSNSGPQRLAVLLGHAEVRGDERINTEGAATTGGSTAVAVGALRAGLARANASLLAADMGLVEVAHEAAESGGGRRAVTRVGASERDASLALLGVLMAAARCRNLRICAFWPMIGHGTRITLKMPLLHESALAALAGCAGGNREASDRVSIPSSSHISCAGLAPGTLKASVPLRFLRASAQALAKHASNAASLLLDMAAAAHDALDGSTSPHARFAQATLCSEAAQLISRSTSADDAAANSLIEREAVSRALALAPDVEALARQLNQAAITCAVPVSKDDIPSEDTLAGFVEVHRQVGTFTGFQASLHATAAAVGARSRPFPAQHEPLAQLAALLVDLKAKSSVLPLHTSCTIYAKHVEFSGTGQWGILCPATVQAASSSSPSAAAGLAAALGAAAGVYVGSQGRADAGIAEAAAARKRKRENLISKAPSSRDDAFSACLRRLSKLCESGVIRIISVEFSASVPAGTLVLLGGANGLKMWQEALCIKEHYGYSAACINSRVVTVAAGGGFTSADAAAFANKCTRPGCGCTAASPEDCTAGCKSHGHQKAAADAGATDKQNRGEGEPSKWASAGAATRSEAGRGCPSVRVVFNGKLAFEAKQLILGTTGLRLFASAAEAKAAGIPACILDKAGKFQRNVIAEDEHGNTVKLATFGKDRDGTTTVTHCLAEELARVTKLVFKLEGKGATNDADQKAALRLFSITIASAPAAK